jgi:hypothetical protein
LLLLSLCCCCCHYTCCRTVGAVVRQARDAFRCNTSSQQHIQQMHVRDFPERILSPTTAF